LITNNDLPTDKEIADAVRTLAKAGITPYQSMNYTNNNEVEQFLATMGGSNGQNSNMMSLLPYFMNNKAGNQNIDPNFIKTMMMSNMAETLGSSFFNEDTQNTY
jgi:hypothetical protein